MKLATLKNGSRDGRLVVVSKDLTRATDAARLAPTLQSALDNWARLETDLNILAEQVELGSVPTFRFHEHECESPLPRSFQWADGSAYINHVELVRKARGDKVPESFYADPLMYQGGSDGFLGPRDAIPLKDAAWGCDMEGEIAVITDDVPMGVSEAEAADHIKLIMLCNDVSLRGLIAGELAKGFGFYQSKPASAFSPAAVTPDELGASVEERPRASAFARRSQWQAVRPRRGGSGRDVFAGAASSRMPPRPGPCVPVRSSARVRCRTRARMAARENRSSEGGLGYSCIAEIRMIETIATGAPKTPFLKAGDTVRIDMLDKTGHSIFGAIEQEVAST